MRISELKPKYFIEHNSFCVIYNSLEDENGNLMTKEEFLRRRATEEQRKRQQVLREQQACKRPPITIEEAREKLKKYMPDMSNIKLDF